MPLALGAALLALVVYANTLGNQLVYDDLGVIAANKAVRDPGDWRTIVFSPSWFALPSKEHRPFTTWTFALDHAVHGLDPFGYHLANALLHAAVVFLLVVLAARMGMPSTVAVTAGAVFAVHPIHTEAVAYVVGRAELLAAACALLVLLAHRSVDGTRRPFLPIAGATIAFALALGAKEHVIALIALVPLADLLLADDGSAARFLARLPGRRGVLYGALIATAVGYVVVRRVALGELVGTGGLAPPSSWQNPAAFVGAWPRVLTACAVQTRALVLLFFPFGLSADYSYRQIPVVTSLADPAGVIGVLVAAALVALGVALWRSKRRLALFWLGFAWLVYLPVSNFLFPIGTIFAERLLYLPSAGWCVLIATGLSRLPRPANHAVTAAIVLAFGVLTVSRNRVWHDQAALAEATVASAPDSTQAHRLLGWVDADRGRNEDAIAEYAKALAIDPGNVLALEDEGIVLQRLGRPAEATPFLEEAARRGSKNPFVWIKLGAARNGVGAFADALDAADRALALRPDNAEALVVRGFSLRGLERPGEARRDFEKALAVAPRAQDALTGLAAIAVDSGDYDAAARALERSIQLAPSRDAYAGLVESYRRAGRDADAERTLAAARARFPGDPAFQ